MSNVSENESRRHIRDIAGALGALEPVPSGFSQVTATSTASDLLPSPSADTQSVTIQPDQSIRFRFDGSPPTSSVGFLLSASDIMAFSIEEVSRLEIISVSGSDVSVNIQQYK